MAVLHPTDRPKPQLAPLVGALAAHRVDWVLYGSYVLALHGARITPNDLDMVPSLAPGSLERLADCLREVGAVCSWSPDWTKPLEECVAWRPDPPTAENLDQLLVTSLGLLDVVIAHAPPYADLMRGAAPMHAEGVTFHACDPRTVLRDLEGRRRCKDVERAEAYAELRRCLGMPDLSAPGGE